VFTVRGGDATIRVIIELPLSVATGGNADEALADRTRQLGVLIGQYLRCHPVECCDRTSISPMAWLVLLRHVALQSSIAVAIAPHKGTDILNARIARTTTTAAALTLAALLAGCWGSDNDSRDTRGSIGFDESPGILMSKGSTREVILSLKNSSGVTGQTVKIGSSDTAVADISPATCTLSSTSVESGRCRVKVFGKSTGSVILTAQSTGYADAPLNTTVLATTVYGQLAVANDSGTFVSTTPVTATFPAAGVAPYSTTLRAQITGSSGLTSDSGAYINFSSSVTGVTFNPPQCQVTTAAPECDTVVSLPTATTTSIAVAVVGAITAQNSYASITVNATPNTTPDYGSISVSTQSGNNVPNGMKAPLFINWTNAGQADSVKINLSIAGTGVSFYNYTPGNNSTINTSTTATCTLTNTLVASTSQLNCGLGLVGAANSGSVTISATATATSNHAYTIAPLTVGAIAPEATRRSVTFTNNSSSTIYVGITGGAASSYLNATTSAVPPGTTSADMKPGAGSLCGPSNPQAACPIGTACIQGGSAPNSDVSKSPFYCYYDQNSPSNGYQIATNGGTTTLDISASSISPNGIIWSGNFYARTGCNSTTGVCENATCVGTAGGLVCGPGTGPSPGTNTLAELTFQAYPATDYYDVSIINGINFATQFGPTNVAISNTNGYSCGTAGSPTAQNGGFVSGTTTTAGLPAASWTMSPTSSASFPPGVTLTGDASSYYRVVSPSTSTATSCTTSSACTSSPDTTCGYAMSSVAQGTAFNFGSRVCGKPVAWITADGIWGLNSTSSNVAPFSFTTNWNNGLTPAGTVSVGDLQLCINSTYSAYTGNGTTTSSPAFPIQPIALACGGVMWGATESPGPLQNPTGNVGLNITPPAQTVQTANTNWLTYVLPTINWLKAACPTCYTYPFDDMTSTFTCADASRNPSTSYAVTFSNTN
jgi:hypothetical protein